MIGEPYAGEPHVRFGGQGAREPNRGFLPPIRSRPVSSRPAFEKRFQYGTCQRLLSPFHGFGLLIGQAPRLRVGLHATAAPRLSAMRLRGYHLRGYHLRLHSQRGCHLCQRWFHACRRWFDLLCWRWCFGLLLDLEPSCNPPHNHQEIVSVPFLARLFQPVRSTGFRRNGS